MPIYAYRCEHCGHAKDVLQRISDPVLTECPACGEPTFRKQVTAAGFQLKGSGWYVTDFTGDKPAGKAADAKPDSTTDGDATPADAKTGEGAARESPTASGSGEGGKSTKSEPSASAPSTAAPAATAPASGSGGPPPGRPP